MFTTVSGRRRVRGRARLAAAPSTRPFVPYLRLVGTAAPTTARACHGICHASGPATRKVTVAEGPGRDRADCRFPNSNKFDNTGAPGRTRTCDPRLRRPVLYPTELRARGFIVAASTDGISGVALRCRNECASPGTLAAWTNPRHPGVAPAGRTRLGAVARGLRRRGRRPRRRRALDLARRRAWVGYHLRHLAGSTDRLLTYARGSSLSDAQRAALAAESANTRPGATAAQLLEAWRAGVGAALTQLGATPESALTEPAGHRPGRAALDAAGGALPRRGDASRHTGRVVTTAKIVQSSRDAEARRPAARPRQSCLRLRSGQGSSGLR